MTKWQKVFLFVAIVSGVLILLRVDGNFDWIETVVGEIGDWYARQTGQQGPVVPPYNP